MNLQEDLSTLSDEALLRLSRILRFTGSFDVKNEAADVALELGRRLDKRIAEETRIPTSSQAGQR